MVDEETSVGTRTRRRRRTATTIPPHEDATEHNDAPEDQHEDVHGVQKRPRRTSMKSASPIKTTKTKTNEEEEEDDEGEGVPEKSLTMTKTKTKTKKKEAAAAQEKGKGKEKEEEGNENVKRQFARENTKSIRVMNVVVLSAVTSVLVFLTLGVAALQYGVVVSPYRVQSLKAVLRGFWTRRARSESVMDVSEGEEYAWMMNATQLAVMRAEIESAIRSVNVEVHSAITTAEAAGASVRSMENEIERMHTMVQSVKGEMDAARRRSKQEEDRARDAAVKSDTVMEKMVREIVGDALRAGGFTIGGTPRPDYALMSAGAAVIEHSKLAKYAPMGPDIVWWQRMAYTMGISRVHPKASAWVLSPSSSTSASAFGGSSFNSPGDCLPFDGRSGHLLIRLRQRIELDSVGVEHIPQSVAYDISTAPRDFSVSVYDALNRTATTRRRVGDFSYRIDATSGPSQIFAIADTSATGTGVPATHIRFDFASNHGNAYVTCVYRLKVFGTPIKA